ncbi:MAG: sigma-54-dependent Fis family transcriptional regulator, partial [Candidatus Krumholzibacteria bacterium]|nr:sigma-54-dependent Fis family transcriptional regulator [Candidatus Krumholzibacteria bacterium]
EEARLALLAYGWPGNIRELKNLMERSVLLGSGEVLEEEHLQLQAKVAVDGNLAGVLQDVLMKPLPGEGVDLEGLVNELEESLVRKAFQMADGNQTEAARLLGLNRDKFRYRLKQYGIKGS